MALRPTTKKVRTIADSVKRQFGDEAGIQVTDQDIFRWVNDAQLEILSQNRMFKGKATSDLVAGQFEYAFPNVPIIDIQSIQVNGQKVEYRSFQEFEEYITGVDPNRTNSGTPTVWTEWAGTLVFYPTPDASGTASIVIYYTQGPADVDNLDDTLSVPDLYVPRIIEYCMAQAYELDEDYQASSMKLQQFTQGVGNLDFDGNDPRADVYPTITVLNEDF